MKTFTKKVEIDRHRVTQFHKESESWKRVLEYVKAENSYLKTRIADIVTHVISKELLVEAENFQTHFIRKDEMIALARNDIRDFDAWMAREDTGVESTLKEGLQLQSKLRTEMEKLEQRFNKLKFEFLNYFAENL